MPEKSNKKSFAIDEGYTRPKGVLKRYPFSSSTMWRKVGEGTFPKPYKLSAAIAAFKNSELAEWEEDPLNYRAK